jgi:hypothetical protein
MNSATPFVSPSITSDVDGEPVVAVVQPPVPVADVSTTYETTGIPPVFAGASHEKDNRPLPVEMEILVGAVASVAGVTTDIALGKPLPTEFEAMTRKMYVVPLERPVAMNDVAIVVVTVVQEVPPFVERSTMYPVIESPPSLAGVTHATVVWPDSTVVVTDAGASGSVGVVGDTCGRNGVMGLAIVAQAPRPTAVTAATRNI